MERPRPRAARKLMTAAESGAKADIDTARKEIALALHRELPANENRVQESETMNRQHHGVHAGETTYAIDGQDRFSYPSDLCSRIGTIVCYDDDVAFVYVLIVVIATAT